MDDGRFFKCCKKPLKSLVCVTCLNVFHPSCGERIRGFAEIRGHLIYCSDSCKNEKINDEQTMGSFRAKILDLELCLRQLEQTKDETIQQLESRLDKAVASSEEQKKYIKRQRRLTQEFTEDAELVEGRYLKQIDALETCNRELRRKIIQFEKLNAEKNIASVATQTNFLCQNQFCQTDDQEDPTSALVAAKDINRELQHKIYELEELRSRLLISVETLTVENEYFGKEVRSLQNEIQMILDRDSQKAGDSLQAELAQAYSKADTALVHGVGQKRHPRKLQRILVLGDESGKNITATLHRIVGDQFKVSGYLKPYASVSEVSRGIFGMTHDYSFSDFVIVFLHVNYNAVRRASALKQILALGKYTNLTVCYRYGHGMSRNLMYRGVNTVLSNFRIRNNISIRVIDNFEVGFGYRHNEQTLSQIIYNYITTPLPFYSLKSNLTYIPTQPEVTRLEKCGAFSEFIGGGANADAVGTIPSVNTHFLDPTAPILLSP